MATIDRAAAAAAEAESRVRAQAPVPPAARTSKATAPTTFGWRRSAADLRAFDIAFPPRVRIHRRDRPAGSRLFSR
ncbi:hypothetical protein GCM10009547_47020 [Sporichthya brevicatena]|uniref:Uncharacterized protein n=1 Tax=Sporichthya brevicatena TaxID=171442 RepID=A0ABP3SG55_9ACTN